MNDKNNIKKSALTLLFVLFVGGVGGVLMDRVVLPYLASFRMFKNVAVLNPQAPLVITRREEVRITEGINNAEVINKIRPALAVVYVHEGDFGSKKFKLISQLNAVIITSDGVLAAPIVNLRQGQKLTAILSGLQTKEAELVANDALTGVSYLKIAVKDLPVAQPGFSQELSVGDRLLAIKLTENSQDPFMIPATVTKKFSASGSLDKVYDFSRLNNFLQIEPNLSSADLGSVAANKDGLVVGLAVQIGEEIVVLRSEDFKLSINNFLDDQKIVWPALKLSYQIFEESQTKLFNIPKKYGILVKQAVAPLHEADFMYAVNDKELSPQESLQDILLAKKPGERIRFKLLRNAQELVVEIVLQ
ncbi:MAG: serine protease [Candidatus Doudnabacteria bacterium]|nr:serine protease [Candidatus Doudnabacteria bacterium]